MSSYLYSLELFQTELNSCEHVTEANKSTHINVLEKLVFYTVAAFIEGTESSLLWYPKNCMGPVVSLYEMYFIYFY